MVRYSKALAAACVVEQLPHAVEQVNQHTTDALCDFASIFQSHAQDVLRHNLKPFDKKYF